MVSGLCTVNAGIRLTPALDDPAAAALLQQTAAATDAAWPHPAGHAEVTTRWPPYALPDGTDEQIRLDSIPAVPAACQLALLILLRGA